MSCEQLCGRELKSISGSIFFVKLVEDNFKTTVVEFTELIKNFTVHNAVASGDKSIRQMANFTMKQGQSYSMYVTPVYHFETVEFLQRKIKTSIIWS